VESSDGDRIVVTSNKKGKSLKKIENFGNFENVGNFENRFVESSDGDRIFVSSNKKGCWSSVGHRGSLLTSVQELNLQGKKTHFQIQEKL